LTITGWSGDSPFSNRVEGLEAQERPESPLSD
jgi:hypothetical protein